MLIGKTVVLGVTGSIAAWQTPEIIGRLRDLMLNVYCIMTKSATEFITPLTLQVSSQNPVAIDMFERRKEWNIAHIALADIADLLLIAPATANIIGKLANGIADDMLSTTVLATKAPIVIAPAMNPNMYSNKITQVNIKKLKELNYHFIDPEYGKTACGTEGVGRLARIPVIINKVIELLEAQDKKEKKE
jgi:phosphopantothenoylcysteine decarboxylase/phosphopantothenate--cysteine ligase